MLRVYLHPIITNNNSTSYMQQHEFYNTRFVSKNINITNLERALPSQFPAISQDLNLDTHF
jgi:hypothetical protein